MAENTSENAINGSVLELRRTMATGTNRISTLALVNFIQY